MTVASLHLSQLVGLNLRRQREVRMLVLLATGDMAARKDLMLVLFATGDMAVRKDLVLI